MSGLVLLLPGVCPGVFVSLALVPHGRAAAIGIGAAAPVQGLRAMAPGVVRGRVHAAPRPVAVLVPPMVFFQLCGA